MGRLMKKKIIISVVCMAVLLSSLAAMFFYYHPTHYKYNDRFIIGYTADEIIERYGEFSQAQRSEDGELTCGIYMIRDNTPEMIMSYDNSLWYEIYFQDGIAVSIKLQEGRRGG